MLDVWMAAKLMVRMRMVRLRSEVSSPLASSMSQLRKSTCRIVSVVRKRRCKSTNRLVGIILPMFFDLALPFFDQRSEVFDGAIYTSVHAGHKYTHHSR
jgi:hypothetical protein